MQISKIFRISICKTIRFNLFYLGIKGIFRPAFLVGKNILFYDRLKGKVEIEDYYRRFGIHIGIQENELTYYKANRGIWNNCGKVIFKGSCNLGCGIRIATSKSGIIIFGDDCSINGNTEIIATKKIEFCSSVNISWGCLFMDTDFHSIYEATGKCINENKEIIIGEKSWIGARALVLKGVHLCANTIIGAGSVITKGNTEKNQIIVGNNRVTYKNVRWKM